MREPKKNCAGLPRRGSLVSGFLKRTWSRDCLRCMTQLALAAQPPSIQLYYWLFVRFNLSVGAKPLNPKQLDKSETPKKTIQETPAPEATPRREGRESPYGH